MMQVWTVVRGNRLGKAIQAIDDRDQAIADAEGLHPRTRPGAELRPFGLSDPQPEHAFFAVGIERERNMDSFVADQAVVADFDPQRVEEDDRVNGIERPVLSFRTSSKTASVTRLIRLGETSMP